MCAEYFTLSDLTCFPIYGTHTHNGFCFWGSRLNWIKTCTFLLFQVCRFSLESNSRRPQREKNKCNHLLTPILPSKVQEAWKRCQQNARKRNPPAPLPPWDGEQAVCCFHRQRSVFWTCHNVSVRVLFLDAAISETLIGAYKSQRDFQNYEGLSTEACRKKSPYISKSSLLADFNHLLRSLKSSLWLYLTYQE